MSRCTLDNPGYICSSLARSLRISFSLSLSLSLSFGPSPMPCYVQCRRFPLLYVRMSYYYCMHVGLWIKIGSLYICIYINPYIRMMMYTRGGYKAFCSYIHIVRVHRWDRERVRESKKQQRDWIRDGIFVIDTPPNTLRYPSLLAILSDRIVCTGYQPPHQQHYRIYVYTRAHAHTHTHTHTIYLYTCIFL
jgi:hypothetical protein